MNEGVIPTERIAKAILVIRNQRVLLDADLAKLYGVETRTLNQAVHRNEERFPSDFMFQLTVEEAARLRSQIVILNAARHSPRAIAVNIEIMRAFVELRRVIESTAGLSRKLDALERKYDGQFQSVFEAIRQLMAPRPGSRRKIGFK